MVTMWLLMMNDSGNDGVEDGQRFRFSGNAMVADGERLSGHQVVSDGERFGDNDVVDDDELMYDTSFS